VLTVLTRIDFAESAPATWHPRPRPKLGGTLVRLAPGFYIVRSRDWMPAAKVLDTNENLPLPPLLELPKRVFPYPKWHEGASCLDKDYALFFGDDTGARPALRRSVLARARRVCAPCEVSVQCLTHALTLPEKYGIWGGTSGRQRELLQERIKRGETVDALVTEVLGG
jgi:hypothetical protein